MKKLNTHEWVFAFLVSMVAEVVFYFLVIGGPVQLIWQFSNAFAVQTTSGALLVVVIVCGLVTFIGVGGGTILMRFIFRKEMPTLHIMAVSGQVCLFFALMQVLVSLSYVAVYTETTSALYQLFFLASSTLGTFLSSWFLLSLFSKPAT